MQTHSKKGHLGHHVAAVQRALRRHLPHAYQQPPVSGFFCSATEASVRQFQLHSSLEPSGQVCPETLSRLFGFYKLSLKADLQFHGPANGPPASQTPPPPARARQATIAQADDSPRSMQLQLTAGRQFAYSGSATQLTVAFMVRQPRYRFIQKDDPHPESAFTFTLQPPNGPPNVYTGQLSYTYTFADMATYDRVHLLNPFITTGIVFPLNSGNRAPAKDPSRDTVIGTTLGNTITYDLYPDGSLSINAQGFVAANVHLPTRTIQLDTGMLLYLQGSIGMGRPVPRR
jgi:hypothetical protein